MLNRIIGFSVKNKLVIALLVFGLAGWGSYEVTRLPIDAVPDITDNQVQVITVSPALGAPDIERLITFPIEHACSNIPGLKQIRSFSRFGLSLVTVVFNDGVDIYWSRQQIAERLQQVQQGIPDGIGSPEMGPVSTGLGEIYQYVLRPLPGYESKYGPQELRTFQDWIVRRQLLGTPGIAEVSSFGGQLKQYEIAVKQEQLKAHNLTIADVFDALEKNNQNTGGAYIEKGPTVLYIRSEGLTTSLDDIRKIVVKQVSGGMPLLMQDVAQVQYGSAIRYGAMTYNDKGEVAGAVVMMQKGENSSVVIKRVKEKIEKIQAMLPEGVIIEPFLDRTKMVNNAISTVETNLIEGALIVIFVLVFFLGNLRAGLIVSSVIPLSMLFAIILMNQFGVGGNLMSLGAIDFGLIVDGSVIVVEAILHRFSHSKKFRNVTKLTQPEMDTEVAYSTGTMIKSAVFSQIIILIVYLPILSLEGIEGKMFRPMALTIAFAILGAFLLSVTYVPMMSALCLSKKISHKLTITDKLMIWLQRRYQPALKRVMRFPATVIAVTLALFAVSVMLLTRMGGEFIPQLEEGDFAVETRLLTGSNLQTTIDATQKASAILLKEYPEVEKIVTKIGSAEIPTDPMPFEAGDMVIILKDKSKWTSASSFPELSEKMTKSLEAVPGITVGFQFPVQMRFNELMTGARQDVVCKIFGENLDTLTHYAASLASIMRTIPGAINIYEERVTGMPQVVIHYNRDAMARYGLNVIDINRVVNTAFAGQSAGQVYEGEKRFDMVVRLNGEARKNVKDVHNLLVPTSMGTQIPLSMVATIEETEGVNQIQRENTRRRIIVGFNVTGRDVQSIVQELQEKVAAKLPLSKGYTIQYGGSFENMTAAKERLSIVVPVALLMIFLLLYFAFGSVKQGLLIYTAIPLSAIGGILALWGRDLPFSISAGVGFIALFGVAVLNGILLVSEFNRLRREGWHDVRRIVVHATRSKLRAVLMTALVPALGFIPMAISTGAGGEVQKPLATVVIGGLIVSTMLTLFVLPVLYILFEKGYARHRNNNSMKTIILLFSLLLPAAMKAQQSVTLQAALDSALRQNLSLDAMRTRTSYYQAMVGTNADIDQTRIEGEYGQFNSRASDNRFAISQSLLFPTVYKRQAQVNRTQVRISEAEMQQTALELKTRIRLLFYQLLILNDRGKLLSEADSLYEQFLQRARLRLKAGDTDQLEVAAAENQRQQIASQLQLLQADYEAGCRQLQAFMNVGFVPQPSAGTAVYSSIKMANTSLQSNPLLQRQQEEVLLSEQQLKLERSRLLPGLQAGVNSTTLIGWQSTGETDQRYYGSDKRFYSVQAGIGIPLFSRAQRKRIEAARVQIRQRNKEEEALRQQLQVELKNATQLYDRRRQATEDYKRVVLPNAIIVLRTADTRMKAGEIGYIEWVVLVNQSIQIRGEYLGLLQEMNEAAINIERISNIN